MLDWLGTASASRTPSSTASCLRPPPRTGTSSLPRSACATRCRRGGALPAVGARGLLRRGAAALGARRGVGCRGRRAVSADEAAPAQRLPLGHGLPGGARRPDGRRGDGAPGGASGWCAASARRSAPTLPRMGPDAAKYVDDLVERFRNPAMPAPPATDRLGRIAEDPRAVARRAAGAARGRCPPPPTLELAVAALGQRHPTRPTPGVRSSARPTPPRRRLARCWQDHRPTPRPWSPPSSARSAPRTSPSSPASPRPWPRPPRPCKPGGSKSDQLRPPDPVPPASAVTGDADPTAMRQWHIQFTRHREGTHDDRKHTR